MKRLLLIIVLLGALVAIGWLKHVRDTQREADIRSEASSANQAAVAREQATSDSLKDLLGERESTYSQELTSRDAQLVATADSLDAIIAAQGETIDSLTSANDKLAEKASNTTPATQGKAAHKDILAYYKQEADKLPGDLSTYERRVALSEIRTRTAKKYAITVTRLNEIRQKYHIDY